ncbi:MAG: CbiX/SirB N-terminal domain-containing protein [Bryobacterales bacterium]
MSASAQDGLIVFAHGSRVAEANDAVRRVAELAARESGFPLWHEAFLELAQPTLAEAVHALAARGARRIVVTPYFLVMGIHLQRDLPLLLDEARAQTPGVELITTPPLDGHPGLAHILSERAREAVR